MRPEQNLCIFYAGHKPKWITDTVHGTKKYFIMILLLFYCYCIIMFYFWYPYFASTDTCISISIIHNFLVTSMGRWGYFLKFFLKLENFPTGSFTFVIFIIVKQLHALNFVTMRFDCHKSPEQKLLEMDSRIEVNSSSLCILIL